MTDLWLPGFERRDLGPDGGPYDDTTNPKMGWHTTEGNRLAGAEAAFAKYPPHLGVSPAEKLRRQYVALNRHAYAFSGSESDDEYIVQVEVVGFAAQMHQISQEEIEWLAVEVVLPIERAVGVPPVIVSHGFHGADEGIRPYIASKQSPIRLTPAQLRAFSGHLGHQHMPGDDDPNDGDNSGDAHWDPGRLPINRILDAAARARTPDQGDDMLTSVLDSYELYLGISRATVIADKKLRTDVDYHTWLLTSGKETPEQSRAKFADWARKANPARL